jgi:hypothetical protein
VNVESIEARLVRMEALSRGLAKEIALVNDDHGVLLWLEKRAYLDAIHRAWGGVESARVALSKAVRRLRDGAA